MELTGASGKEWKLKVGQQLRNNNPTSLQDGYLSETYMVKDRESKTSYVLKTQGFASPNCGSPNPTSFMEVLIDEAAIWRKVGLANATPGSAWPKNVVQLVDVFLNRQTNQISFLSESCSKGHVQRRGANQQYIIMTIVQLCDALIAVYNSGVPVHGNVGYSSVFVAEDGSVKLSGFGAGRRKMLETTREPLSSAVDVRALGALMYEMCTGQPASRSGKVVMPPECETILSASAVQLANAALAVAPDARPGIMDLRNMLTDILAGRPVQIPGGAGAAAAGGGGKGKSSKASGGIQKQKSVLASLRAGSGGESSDSDADGRGSRSSKNSSGMLQSQPSLRDMVKKSGVP
eukprot:CAMPEP_0184707766 /NCGR_PEP_ID=MMETSP0313-20130426/37437_1 /TAXON_ID=2792 /ORGANISM="Porphyridium aerugineum, Strain SAG 1380-2" /LENGTH=347 /DNA_ID=CAMNT_0027169347 /DNA_START=348 /DNA_END=1388 /DNA_ORIENTATION=+